MSPYFILFAVSFQPFVGFYPDAFSIVRIDLAPAIIAAATGRISLVLGTLRHGAEIGDVGQCAVTTIHAVEERYLGKVFEA